LIAVFASPGTFIQWLQSILVLLSYSIAIAGITLIPAKLKLPAALSAAFAVLISLAWLTWPIWLSPTLTKHGEDKLIGALIRAHPPLVINGILTHDPAWTERSLAYRLTNLNQDVPIQFPHTPLVCVAIHGMIAIALWGAASWGIPRRAARLYP